MTLNDFKMWLAGYSENITEAPTPAQWKRIQEALASIPGPGGVTPAVNIPTVWIDPRQHVSGGTGSPPQKWPESVCQNELATIDDRARREANNQTVEVR